MNIQEASQTIPGRLVTTEHPDNTVPRKNNTAGHHSNPRKIGSPDYGPQFR